MKKVLVVLCIVILIITIGIFWVIRSDIDSEDNYEEITELSFDERFDENCEELFEVLKFRDIEALKDKAAELELPLQESETGDFVSFSNFYVLDSIVQLYYQGNEDGRIERIDGTAVVNLDKDCLDINSAIAYLGMTISKFFDIELLPMFSVYSVDGQELNLSQIEAEEKMLDGEARMGLSVLDVDSSLWYVRCEVKEGNELQIKFFHILTPDMYDIDTETVHINLVGNQETENNGSENLFTDVDEINTDESSDSQSENEVVDGVENTTAYNESLEETTVEKVDLPMSF